MSADKLLQRLDKVKKTGTDKWQACCPAHADKRPSLAIRETNDGRVLLHCFAGCGAAEVLAAVGLEFSDLFPEGFQEQSIKPVRRAFSASDALRAVTFEGLVVLAVARTMLQSGSASYERLVLAVSRLQAALTVAEG